VSWILAIGLALAAFALAAWLFRAPRQGWTTLAAALALGLAGYALQASPGLRGAPAQPARPDQQLGSALVEARKAMIADDSRSRSDKLITADAFARNGQYDDAVTFLRIAVAENPRDAEAWLALANALVEHADGALTPPALLAYRRAEAADPDSAGPGYFIGLAMLRQGRVEEARDVWRRTLEGAAPEAPGREQLAMLLGRLESAIAAATPSAAAPSDAPATLAPPAARGP
jgi:cytochrome c-type biogenesis protein CcmH